MALYIDASNRTLGRLASYAARKALAGERIFIVNAEKAVISGNPDFVLKRYREMIKRGDPYHGPFFPRLPDRILKRTIRGMLSHRKPRGREALKRVKVYISVPEELSSKEKEFKRTENKLECKFITLGKLSKHLGAKRTW